MFYAPIQLAFNIPAGQAVSQFLNVGGLHLLELRVPNTWDTASITFTGSVDGVNHASLRDASGAEVVLASGAGFITMRLPPAIFQPCGLASLAIRSGTVATPVNQTGARTVLVSALQRM